MDIARLTKQRLRRALYVVFDTVPDDGYVNNGQNFFVMSQMHNAL